MRFLKAVFFVCVLLVGLPSLAQSRKSSKQLPASAHKLTSVQVSGTKRYPPADVIHATGLQLGQTVHEQDFKDAVRLLGDTGVFSDVAYSFEYSPDGTKLELHVQDAQPFVAARFENVVWFSTDDLLGKLHARVPLFHGELPVRGDLVNQVSDALQALLSENKVAGGVDYLRAAPEDGPAEAFVFSVTGPHITVRNLSFSGAAPSELPLLEAASRKLQGMEYVRSALRVQEDKSFLPIYRSRGYLKAVFGDPEAKVVKDERQETLVDVTFPVNPGPQFRLAELVLKGNKAFSADRLRQLIHLQMDQPINAVQLEKDVEAIKQLYGTRGYAEVAIKAEPELDDAQNTVRYQLIVTEGDLYKMGDLEIQGLDSRTTARLQNEWTLRAGDTYDSGYPGRFIQQAYKEIGDWNTSLHESLNRQDKTVDVSIRFDPKS